MASAAWYPEPTSWYFLWYNCHSCPTTPTFATLNLVYLITFIAQNWQACTMHNVLASNLTRNVSYKSHFTGPLQIPVLREKAITNSMSDFGFLFSGTNIWTFWPCLWIITSSIEIQMVRRAWWLGDQHICLATIMIVCSQILGRKARPDVAAMAVMWTQILHLKRFNGQPGSSHTYPYSSRSIPDRGVVSLLLGTG